MDNTDDNTPPEDSTPPVDDTTPPEDTSPPDDNGSDGGTEDDDTTSSGDTTPPPMPPAAPVDNPLADFIATSEAIAVWQSVTTLLQTDDLRFNPHLMAIRQGLWGLGMTG